MSSFSFCKTKSKNLLLFFNFNNGKQIISDCYLFSFRYRKQKPRINAMILYVKQAFVYIKGQEFFNLPEEDQLLEKAAILFAEWYQPNIMISHSQVTSELDKIADTVLERLAKRKPFHAIFKTTCETRKQWRLKNLNKNEFEVEEVNEIVECMYHVIFEELGFETINEAGLQQIETYEFSFINRVSLLSNSDVIMTIVIECWHQMTIEGELNLETSTSVLQAVLNNVKANDRHDRCVDNINNVDRFLSTFVNLNKLILPFENLVLIRERQNFFTWLKYMGKLAVFIFLLILLGIVIILPSDYIYFYFIFGIDFFNGNDYEAYIKLCPTSFHCIYITFPNFVVMCSIFYFSSRKTEIFLQDSLGWYLT